MRASSPTYSTVQFFLLARKGGGRYFLSYYFKRTCKAISAPFSGSSTTTSKEKEKLPSPVPVVTTANSTKSHFYITDKIYMKSLIAI
jgi:hypothetical protein